jgi:signal transduction histidine kinase
VSAVAPPARHPSPAPPEKQPGWEESYQEWRLGLLGGRLRIAALAAAALLPPGILLELITPPRNLAGALGVRFGAAGLSLLIFAAVRTSWGARWARALSFVHVGLLGMGVELIRSAGGGPNYYAGLMVVLLAVGVLYPWSPRETAVAAAFYVAIELVPGLLGWLPVDRQVLINNTYFLATGGAVAILASVYATQARRREFFAKRSLEEQARALDEANRRLDESLEKMRQHEKAKAHLFARINHELRTPLTLIVAPLSELLGGSFDLEGDVRRRLELVRRNAGRLDVLVSQVLELAKADKGLVDTERGPVDLAKVVGSVAREFDHLASSRGAQLRVSLAKLPPIMGDPEGLATVARNLLSNAFKFMPGKGEVAVELKEKDGCCVLEVRDQGIGIAEADKQRIFELFARASDPKVSAIPGSGIGLAVVQELVRQHQGRVEVESAPGQGATFRVLLPRSAEV